MHTVRFSPLLNKFLTAALILALALAALPVSPAYAASIAVNTTTDENANNAFCSLREAIIAANNNASYNGCTYSGGGPDDVITLTSGSTYTLSLVGSTAATGDLDVGNLAGTSGNLTIQASGNTNAIIDANDINRVFEVDSPVDINLTLIHITVTDGTQTDGAGIYFNGAGTLTLDHSKVSANTGTGGLNCGAGIYNNTLATINIIDSTIESNTCTTAGADGAGIFKGTGGTLNITNSTFYNNSTTDNGGGARIDMGSGTANITNSTFVDNSAGARGGGIQAKSGTVNINFSTFSGNSANSAGGGGAVQSDGGTVTVWQSILANSLINAAPGSDCDQFAPGTVNADGSLVELNTDCSGQIAITQDPKLDTLGDNGGPTLTMALLTSSLAINAADDATCPDTDQRGIDRPQGTHCDLGAFELAAANVEVKIAGNLQETYSMVPGESTRDSYDNVDDGPVKVESTNGVPIISSERINLKNGLGFESYTEFLGLPASKLSDTYIFPWYNNATAGGLSSQLRFANVGNAQTTITIKIAGVAQGLTYTLDPNESDRVTLDNVDNGPVEVKSSGGVPIIASMRINLKSGKGFESYTEFLGLSASSTASTTYMFPWYNNATAGGLSSQLRFGNVGNATTTVTIKVAGVAQAQTYTLDPNESDRVTLDNVDNGPVEVISSNNVPIIAAMRVNLKNDVGFESYSEFIGLPGATLTETRYLFPWYNNATAGGVSSQLRIANVGNAQTTVTVKVAGVAQVPTYTLDPNESARVTLDNVDSGPVEVVSSGGVPIIASMRVNLKSGLGFDSYSEFIGLSVGSPLGLPTNELSTTYWFPWYNNATLGGLSSQLRIGVP